MDQFVVTLTKQQIDVIFAAMSEQPFKTVSAVFQAIIPQLQQQQSAAVAALQAQQKAVEAANTQRSLAPGDVNGNATPLADAAANEA